MSLIGRLLPVRGWTWTVGIPPPTDGERLAALRAVVQTLLDENGGPTGGDTYFGEPDTHVLVRIEDFTALESAMKADAVDPSASDPGTPTTRDEV